MGGFYGHFAGFGEEATFGTAVARTSWCRIRPGTMAEPLRPRTEHELIGFRSVQRYIDGIKSGAGKLAIPAAYQGLGLIWKHALGLVAHTGSSNYTHTHKLREFSPPASDGSAEKPSLTIETNMAFPTTSSEALIAEGAVITRLNLSWRNGEQLQVEVDYAAEDVTLGAVSGSPTYKDLDTYLVKPAQITANISAGAASIRSFQLTIENNLETGDAYLGSANIMLPYAKSRRKISGQIEKFWDDAGVAFGKFDAGTNTPIVITCTGPTNHGIVITIPKAVYTGKTPEPQQGGQLPHVLTFDAIDDSTDTAVKIVETNTLATA